MKIYKSWSRKAIILSALFFLTLSTILVNQLFTKTISAELKNDSAPKSPNIKPEKGRPIRFVNSKIIVKLKPGYGIAAKSKNAGSISVSSQSSVNMSVATSLQTQLNNFGVIEIRKTLPRAKKPSDAISALVSKFPKSAKRIQPQSTLTSLPDLTNFYTLTVDPKKVGINARQLNIIQKGQNQNTLDSNSPDYKRMQLLVKLLKANPAVEQASLSFLYTATANNILGGGGSGGPSPYPSPVPDPYANDPFLSSGNSWNQGYDDLWGIKKIKADQAWSSIGIGSTASYTIVAVSDSGIDYNHPDLKSVIWSDPNGKHGYDFVNSDDDPMDDAGHGTHVAGIIGATINNSKGVAGVASNTRLMSVKGLDKYGYGTDEALAQGIIWATDNGAAVINMSWGGYGDSVVISNALEYAYSMGVTLVAAAGNDGMDTRYSYPANSPLVIAVGASDENDNKTFFSNYGPKVDLVAPGGGTTQECLSDLCSNILSTEASASAFPASLEVGTSHNYIRLAGTSMAAPHVAGAAAQVISKNGGLFPSQVRAIILNSADDVGFEGKDSDTGFGRLNVYKAVTQMNTQSLLNPTAELVAPLSGRVLRKSFSVVGTVNQPKGQAHFTLAYSANKNGPWQSTGITLVNGGVGNISKGTLGTWDTTTVQDGKYYFRLLAGDQSKTVDIAQITVNNNLPNGWPAQVYEQGFGWGPIVTGDLDGSGRDSTVIKFGSELAVLNPDGQEKGSWPKSFGDYDNSTYVVPAIGNVVKGKVGNQIVVASQGSVYSDNTILGTGLYVFDSMGNVLPGWPKLQDGTYQISGFGSTPVLADIDGDGTKEIVYISYNQRQNDTLWVFKGDGTSIAGFPIQLPGYTFNDPHIVNINGSPKIVIEVFNSSNGELNLLQYDSHGQIVYQSPNIKTSNPYDEFLLDVTGDGVPEMVWSWRDWPEDYSGVQNVKLYFEAMDLRGNRISGWPKVIDTGVPYKLQSVGDGWYLVLSDFDAYKALPSTSDSDNKPIILQYGVRYFQADINSASTTVTPLVLALKNDGSVLPYPVPSNAPVPISHIHPSILDTNGDGRQEVVYLGVNRNTGIYSLNSLQTVAGVASMVLNSKVASTCSYGDMNGNLMSSPLAQLQTVGRPSVIAPVCGYISDDYYQRRLDVYPVQLTGPVAQHAWSQFLHDSFHSDQFSLVSEPGFVAIPTPTPSPSPTQPTQTLNLQPGWNTFGLTVAPSVGIGSSASDLLNFLNQNVVSSKTATGVKTQGGGGVGFTKISKYDPSTDSYPAYVLGSTSSANLKNNFIIKAGEGYMVSVTDYSNLTVSGNLLLPQTSIQLSSGGNFVSLISVPDSINTAEKLAQSIKGQGGQVSAIIIWDQGAWNVHLAGQNDTNAKIPILPGKGYFIRMTNDLTYQIPAS